MIIAYCLSASTSHCVYIMASATPPPPPTEGTSAVPLPPPPAEGVKADQQATKGSPNSFLKSAFFNLRAVTHYFAVSSC